MKRREVMVDGLAEPISHYADAVVAGDTLYVSGIVPVDASGAVVGDDVVAQARQVFAIMQRVLAAAGATPADVVKVTVYLLDVDDRPLATRCARSSSATRARRARWSRSAASPLPGAAGDRGHRAPAPVTATEIAARVAARELSAEEAVADALARIAARPEPTRSSPCATSRPWPARAAA